MRKIESYANPDEVKERILQLREQGVTESAITLIAKEDIYENEFVDYDVDFKKAEGSAWEKFVSFFTAEEPEDKVIEDLGLTDEETVKYERDLEDGGILLYVNDYEADKYGDQPEPTTGAGGSGFETVGYAAEQDKNYEEEGNGMRDRFEDDERNDKKEVEDCEIAHDYKDNKDEDTVELYEERVNVDKDRVRRGEVDIDKHVESEQQEFDVPVERDEVTVERHKVTDEEDDHAKRSNESFDEAVKQDEETIRVPLEEERVNVTKENVVGEELVIKKNKVQDTEHVSEEVRHEEADVDETYNGPEKDERNDRF